MIFAGLLKTTLIDFPGTPSCVIFTSGCPYTCCFCYNRQTLDGSVTIPEETVHAFLRKRAGLLEGVVVTGGEPTIQPDLADFCRFIKQLGYRLKLDTNGCSPDVVEDILLDGLADYIAIDFKAPTARYREICGAKADGQAVLETIARVHASGTPYELRTTILPQLSRLDRETMRTEVRARINGDPLFWRENPFFSSPSSLR